MGSWNLISAPRDAAVQRASQLKESGSRGDFFIRSVEGPSGNLGLTVLVEVVGTSRRLENFLVERIEGGLYRLRKSNATFSSIDDLVTYYSTEQFPPIPVKLNTNEFDQFKLNSTIRSELPKFAGLDDDEDTTFGFDDEIMRGNNIGLPRDLDTLRRHAQLQQGHTPRGNHTNVMDRTKIELLRKQAEVMSAKRLAAEHNVRMLMEHAAGGGRLSANQVKANHEHETSKRMEAEMAQMQNQGLLAGWQAQMAHIDQLRSSRPMSTVSDTTRVPKGTVRELDASVQKLYSEIGAMNESFSKQVQKVEEEEKKILEEEGRLAVLNGIVSMVKDVIYGAADEAVTVGEITILQRNMTAMQAQMQQSVEQLQLTIEQQKQEHETELTQKENQLRAKDDLYEQTVYEKQETEERLSQIATAMSPLASLLGGVPIDPVYGMAGRQARGSGYGANFQPVASGQHQTFGSPNKTYGSPNKTYGAASSPHNNNFSPPPQARRFETTYGSANPPSNYQMGNSTYERIPGEAPYGGGSNWKNPARVGGGFSPQGPALPPRRAGLDEPTTFSVVKFKKPVQRGQGGDAGSGNSQCTFLGNCQCDNCR
eukprot:m.9915 g.9915  ORF g.9915 m.9915 type:complete len:595 (-) comp8008_c0_seq1:128-1912(-)